MKKLPPILYYLAIGLLLGGYIYLFERGPVKNNDQTKTEKIFDNYVADNIDEIKLENLSTTVTAFREPIVLQKDKEDHWQITAPKKFKADQDTVRQILSNVADFTPQTTIPNPTDLADFGLNTPTARCTFYAKGGVNFVLLIGDKNVTGSAIYVKTPDKNTIYMLPAYMTNDLSQGVNDYRNKSFFQTDGVLATKIRIVRKGRTTVFEKKSNGDWYFKEPIKDRADNQKVEDLLNSINNLQIIGFENDHPRNLAIYGLSKPYAIVDVWNGKKKNEIELGREKLKTTQRFAKSGDLPYVFLINNYFDKTLDIDLTSYRDKTMMQFDATQAKTITVRHNGKTYLYKKNDKGEWTSPGRPNAEAEGEYLLTNLSNTTITDFATPKDVTGLQHPSYVVEFHLNSGANRIYRFGNTLKGIVYLASDQDKEVYEVPSFPIATLDGYYSDILTPVPVTSPNAH